MEQEIDNIITKHDFKSVEDIRAALESAYRAGERYGEMGSQQAVWEAASKLQ